MQVLKTARMALATCVLLTGAASMASAEIVVMTSGGTLSVKSHKTNGDLVTLPITATQFGPADVVDLVFDVDQTFKPGGPDPRELGVRIFNVYIEPK